MRREKKNLRWIIGMRWRWKRRVDLFWVNYHFNFIPWQLQHLPLNWWKANRIVCSDLTFSSKAFECDSTLMNLSSSVIPSWRCTVGSRDWQLCCAHTRANTWKENKTKITQLEMCFAATGSNSRDIEQVRIFFTFIFLFPLPLQHSFLILKFIPNSTLFNSCI